MATVINFTTTSTTDVSPSVHSNWDGTAAAGFVRRLMSTTDAGTSSNQETTESVALGNAICQVQYVSAPLAAQTISGTFDITTSQRVSATGATDFAYNVWVVASNGTTIRGVLNNHTSTSIAVPSSSYSTVSDTSAAITSLAVSDGDYIVVELGYEVNNTGSKTFGTQAGTGSITFSGTISFISAPTSLTYPYTTYTPVTGYNHTSGTPTWTGGEGTVTFTLNSGSLPTGMSLSSTTGIISGSTTSTTATFSPVIKITNSVGNTTKALTFNVKDYDDVSADLTACNSSLSTCNANLSTCNTNLATCNTNLTTCNTNLSTCQSDLSTCETDLAAEVKKKSWTLKPEL